MAEVDFSDLDSAEAWFEKQPRDMICAICCRSALRVLSTTSGSSPVSTDKLALTCMRCLLASATAASGVRPFKEVAPFAEKAAEHVGRITNAAPFLKTKRQISEQAVLHSAMAAAFAAGTTGASRPEAIASKSVGFSLRSAEFSFSIGECFKAVKQDAQFVSENGDDTAIAVQTMRKPLWNIEIASDILNTHNREILSWLRSVPGLVFWHDWYLAMWRGGYDNWNFAFEVIKIEDDVWEAGVDAVAKKIKRIQARLELQNEIAALRDELLKLRQNQTTPTTGHNQGPPIDDSDIQLNGNFDLIWPILDALEDAAAQHSPDISRLKQLALQLWEIASTTAVYCGVKIDIALDKAAETFGEVGTKWAIRAGVATYASANEGVQSVAKLAWNFAKTLSGS